MTAAIRYPSNEITPHGVYYMFKGDQPSMWLDAYDESIRFDVMGGLSLTDRYNSPECVQIPRDGLKGLIPPWRHIDQKGATEDGTTQIDALYDPIEVQMDVVCKGRDGKHLQRVVNHLYASLDAKQESTLNFLTHDMGHWWAPIRWFKGAPQNPLMGAQQRRQPVGLRLRADSGFWRTYDDTDSFEFAYEAMVDDFTTDYSVSQNLGPNWPQRYTGTGGYCSTVPGWEEAAWYEQGNANRDVVNGPYKDFETDTDNQVVQMELGTMPELTFVGGAFNDLWGRMGREVDGTWDGNGIRARIGMVGLLGWVQLTRFNDFTGTDLYERIMIIPPLRGEKYTLVCGIENDPRMFRILRNGLPIVSHKEVGALSELGEDFRGVGFGMHADSTVFLGQKRPSWVRKISAGDNATITQSGFVQRTNIGDQPMYDEYTVFGPGTFRIWNGPNAGPNEYIEFGPLLPNQSAWIRTDPRDRNVYDMATTTALVTQAERGIFASAINGLVSLATIGNTNLILQIVQSIFGLFGAGPAPSPPQGPLYSLLKGRFNDNSAIPPKSPGNPATPYHVKVSIVGGSVDSKIIASATPLRRYPL